MDQNIHWYWNSVSVTAPEIHISYPPSKANLLSTVLTFILLTAWFQVSQLPHFSSPLIAAAEPVQPADKSARKSSTPKVNQFGIFISATLCSDGPWNSYLIPQLNKSTYLSTVLTFILLTAWFQVSQPPLFSSPLMAGAEPVKPADKSVKKSSSSKVSQFGILISATLCSDGPWKSYWPQLTGSSQHS